MHPSVFQAYPFGHGDVIAITSETSTMNATTSMLFARYYRILYVRDGAPEVGLAVH